MTFLKPEQLIAKNCHIHSRGCLSKIMFFFIRPKVFIKRLRQKRGKKWKQLFLAHFLFHLSISKKKEEHDESENPDR